MSFVQKKIEITLNDNCMGHNDVLVCEAQTTMRDPRAAFQVEQVRGIFETLARNRKVAVPGRINPRSVQYELLGLTGKQCCREEVKSSAISVARTLYGNILEKAGFSTETENLKKHQDIIDALLVGRLAMTRICSGLRAGVAVDRMFEERRKNKRPITAKSVNL